MMALFTRTFIAGGFLVASAFPVMAAVTEQAESEPTEVFTVINAEPTGLLLKEGRLPFVLERYLKDGHLLA